MLDLEMELLGTPIAGKVKYTPDKTLGYVRLDDIPVIIRITSNDDFGIQQINGYVKDMTLIDATVRGSWVAGYTNKTTGCNILVVARDTESITNLVYSKYFDSFEFVGCTPMKEHSELAEIVFSYNDGAKDSIIPIIWSVPDDSQAGFYQTVDWTFMITRNVRDTGNFMADVQVAAKNIMDYLENTCPPIDIENEPKSKRYAYFRVEDNVYAYNRNHKAYHGDQSNVKKVAPILLNLAGFNSKAYEYIKDIAVGSKDEEDTVEVDEKTSRPVAQGRPVGKTGNPLIDAALSGHPNYEE